MKNYKQKVNMKYTKLSSPICQQKNEIIPCLKGFFQSYSTSTRKIFFKIFLLNKRYQLVYASQSKLGKLTGYSRKTVNEAVGILIRDGLLEAETRHAKTSIYHIPTSLKNKENATLIKNLFHTFMAFSFAFLVSKAALADDVTQLKLKNEVINKSSHTVTVSNAHCLQRDTGYLQKKRKMDDKTCKRLQELIPKFPLTEHGIIKLSIFPTQAIDYAQSKLSIVLQSKDPFSYFLSLCKKFCQEKGIEIDWSAYYRFKETLKISDDQPYMVQSLLESLQLKATKTPQQDMQGSTLSRANAARLRMQREQEKSVPQRVEETPMEFAMNFEKKMHEIALRDKDFKFSIFNRNPKMSALTTQEQEYVLSQVHQDCNCRQKRDGFVAPTRDVLSQPEIGV